jgi:hypothetical protein
MSDIYATLCARFPNRPSGKGWVALDECPACGRRADNERDRGCAFNGQGYNCFACGTHGSLYDLARKLDIPHDEREYLPRPIRPPQPPRHWQTNPDYYLKKYLEHPQRVDLWQAYRPFSLETIAQWQLGAGVLPNSPCPHTRLIYPAYDLEGKVAAFRGRHLGCDCPLDAGKWITSGGGRAVLWGAELLRGRANMVVFVLEAPPDAMLMMQQAENVIAGANTAGAHTWRDDWTQLLVDAKPELVIVGYDNDLAGMANGEVREALLAEWRENHPKAARPPQAGGWMLLNRLRNAGIPAEPWDWSGRPPGMDMGDILMEEMHGSSIHSAD